MEVVDLFERSRTFIADAWDDIGGPSSGRQDGPWCRWHWMLKPRHQGGCSTLPQVSQRKRTTSVSSWWGLWRFSCCYSVSESPNGLTFTWWACGACPLLFFLFCSCVCFCLYGHFNCISFQKFSRQLSAFSLCSSALPAVLLVFSTIHLFMKVSLSPDIILRGWLGL